SSPDTIAPCIQPAPTQSGLGEMASANHPPSFTLEIPLIEQPLVGTELDCDGYRSLPECRQTVLRAEYFAFRHWLRLAEQARDSLERDAQVWQRLAPVVSARVLGLYSLYRQALLGITPLRRKKG